MDLPASSSGLPSTPGHKPTPATPTPIALTPGQIVSARVLEALGADTYLLALRGRTLVANSPTPLTPDTIVQLAVQAAEDPASPVPVKLLVAAGLTGKNLGDRASAPTAEAKVAAMIAELGLPPGPAATLTVAAFIRLGVPLADPRSSSQTKPSLPLRSLVQVVQTAIDAGSSLETDREPATTTHSDRASAPSIPRPQSQASRATPLAVARAPQTTISGQPTIAPAVTPSSGQVIATAHTPTVESGSAPRANAQTSAEANPEDTADTSQDSNPAPRRNANTGLSRTAVPSTNEPRISGTPTLVSQTRLTLGAYGIVSFTPTPPPVLATSTTDPAVTQRTTDTAEEPADTASRPEIGRPAPSAPATPRPSTNPSPSTSSQTLGTPISPVASPGFHINKSSVVEQATARVATGTTSSDPTTEAARKPTDSSGAPAPRSHEAPLAETYGPRTSRSRSPGIIIAATPGPGPAPVEDAAPAVHRTNTPDVRVTSSITPLRTSIASPVPSAAMAHVTATATASELATAGARLARVTLPVTPATLAVALRAPNAQPVAVARWLPPALAHAIDPAVSAPTTAMRTALQLAGVVPAGVVPAGVVPAGMSSDPAQTLLQHLIRIAISVGSATPPTAPSPTSETMTNSLSGTPVPTTAADPAVRAPGSALTAEAAPDEGRDPALTTAPPTNEIPRVTDPTLAAVREVAAEQLLPPTHLDDYDRIIALPMMHAGQPVPARLAVTTQRTASGGTACWMRVDCALSQLGAVSVRLSGADGGPVAVTLIAAPAAAAVLAKALPALTDDLHAKGVVAALRVVAHSGDLTEVA